MCKAVYCRHCGVRVTDPLRVTLEPAYCSALCEELDKQGPAPIEMSFGAFIRFGDCDDQEV